MTAQDAEQHHRDDGEARRHGEVPAPQIPFAGEEQHQEQRSGQDDRACHVHVGGAAFGGFGHGAPRGQEGGGGDDQAEAVGGPYPAELGEQCGQRVADTGPDDRDHRDQGDHGRAALFGEVVPGHAHHQRRQPEPDALGRPAGQQPRERQRQHGERAAGDDDRQRGEDRGPPVRAGSEPAQDRRGNGAAEQRDGQRPLRAAERDVERGRHAGDERRPEAGDRRHDQSDEHQGRDQQPRLGTRHRERLHRDPAGRLPVTASALRGPGFRAVPDASVPEGPPPAPRPRRR